jgi:DNA invertase Pin-like site-specific DNA recombinase
MIFGYARVSTREQNLERQSDRLERSGCERIFQEKVSGAGRERPELNRLLEHPRPGDILIVGELTRLSRSVKDLFSLMDVIHQRGAHLKSLKEPWLDTTTPQGKLLFSIFAGTSQFERDLISQRTKEGLSSARARGRQGGRPPKPSKNIELAIKMHGHGNCSLAEIKAATGVSKTTLYRYLSDRIPAKLREY